MTKSCQYPGCDRKIITGRKYCYEHRHVHLESNSLLVHKELKYARRKRRDCVLLGLFLLAFGAGLNYFYAELGVQYIAFRNLSIWIIIFAFVIFYVSYRYHKKALRLALKLGIY